MTPKEFLARVQNLPTGYSQGEYKGERWGCTLTLSADGKRGKLFAEDLGGSDYVSFNLYVVGGEPRLKPCEMPEQKVIDFVIGYRQEP